MHARLGPVLAETVKADAQGADVMDGRFPVVGPWLQRTNQPNKSNPSSRLAGPRSVGVRLCPPVAARAARENQVERAGRGGAGSARQHVTLPHTPAARDPRDVSNLRPGPCLPFFFLFFLKSIRFDQTVCIVAFKEW